MRFLFCFVLVLFVIAKADEVPENEVPLQVPMLAPLRPVLEPLYTALKPLAASLFESRQTRVIYTACVAAFFILVQLVISPLLMPLLLGNTFNNLTPSQKTRWHSRITSQIHCILALFGAMAGIVFEPELWTTRDSRFWVYTGWVLVVVCWSGGYFLYDIFISVRFSHIFEIHFLVHAVSCFFAFTVNALCPMPSDLSNALLFLMYEASTPLVNVHSFLEEVKKGGSLLDILNGVVLAILFFTTRIFYGAQWTYRRVGDYIEERWSDQPGRDAPLFSTHFMLPLSTVACCIIMTLNVIWAWQIVSTAVGMARGLGKGKKAKKTE